MRLNAIVEDQVHALDVPEALLREACAFFDQLDADMERGWQMSREWVDAPDRQQRCQIVADKLLTALETGNRRLGLLMAGYLLARLPNLVAVELDIQGEMQNHHFQLASHDHQQPVTGANAPRIAAPSGLNKLDAMAQAGQDVTKVFRVGKGFRFSVFDHDSDTWQDSPLIASEPEAERLRQAAFKARYAMLQAGPGD